MDYFKSKMDIHTMQLYPPQILKKIQELGLEKRDIECLVNDSQGGLNVTQAYLQKKYGATRAMKNHTEVKPKQNMLKSHAKVLLD